MTEFLKRWSPLQLIVGSAVIAVFAWSAIGFSWFGYGFGWTTQGNAQQVATAAVTENLADICVAQARNGAGSQEALDKFAGLQHWKQGNYIEEAKWATMPGSESPHSGVADLCAKKLRQI